MRASFYRAYATRLASWGFLVLQYDVPFLTTLPDTPEVGSAACIFWDITFPPAPPWLLSHYGKSPGVIGNHRRLVPLWRVACRAKGLKGVLPHLASLPFSNVSSCLPADPCAD